MNLHKMFNERKSLCVYWLTFGLRLVLFGSSFFSNSWQRKFCCKIIKRFRRIFGKVINHRSKFTRISTEKNRWFLPFQLLGLITWVITFHTKKNPFCQINKTMPVWSSMNNSREILYIPHMCTGFTQPLATQIQWSMLFLCSLGWLAITDFGSIINILGRYVELVRISELRWIVAHFYGTQMNINLWSGQKKNQWCTFLKFALIFSVLFFPHLPSMTYSILLYMHILMSFCNDFWALPKKWHSTQKKTQVGKKSALQIVKSGFVCK